MISTPPFSTLRHTELFRPHDVCTSSVFTHDFSDPSDRAHDFSVHSSTRTHDFSDRPSARTHDFCNPSAFTHEYFNPSACTHDFFQSVSLYTRVFQSVRLVHMVLSIRHLVRMIFLIRQLVRIVPVICLVSCYQFHSQFLCLSPNLKMDFFAKCVLPLCFKQATCNQDRLRHVHHMEIIPFRLTANSQPDLSLSVFLERFSVGTSETSLTITLFQLGVPKPLGTR